MRYAAAAWLGLWAACQSTPPAARDAGVADAGVPDSTTVDATPPVDGRQPVLEAANTITSLWVDAPSVFMTVSPPTCPLEGPEICYPPVPLIQRGSLTDGSVTTLHEGLYSTHGGRADATHVYFVQTLDLIGGAEIQRIERGGGPPSTVVAAACPFTLDDSYVYWLDGTDITRSDLDGANPVALSSWTNYPSLAPAGDRLFWSDPGVPGIFSVPRAGGAAPTVVASGVSGPLKARDGYLYWTSLVENDTAVFRVPMTGGAVQTVFDGEYGLEAFDVDGEHVYWANQQRRWIKRVPVAGGEVELLLSDIEQSNLLAVDDDTIYWALDRGVYAFPKP